MIRLKLGRAWGKFHDSTHVEVVIRLTGCMIWIKFKLWFELCVSYDSTHKPTHIMVSLYSIWFDSRDNVIRSTHIKSQIFKILRMLEILLYTWLEPISIMVLILKNWLIDLKHTDQTQTQTVWIMHAKIRIQNSILKDAQLNRRLKYKTKFKVKFKRQTMKLHRGLPLNDT